MYWHLDAPMINPWAIDWYRSLSVDQRLFLKESFVDLCGVQYTDALRLLEMREIISIYFNKLVNEGVLQWPRRDFGRDQT